MSNPPVPTALRLLRGNPGRRPIRSEPLPTIAPDTPEPPEFLMPLAKEEWARIARELHRLNLLTVIDHRTFAAYCQSYGRWRTAEEALAKMAERDLLTSGLMIKTTSGNPIQNPLVGTANRAANDMVRYGSELGLSPCARTRIATGDIERRPSKFDGLLAG
jgi:P27 family predicted phage terminase small subunit